MFPIDLAGKKGIVFGVASDRSIAWAISKRLSEAGAQLAFAYQNERLRPRVEKLTADLEDALLLECDVNVDGAVEGIFESIRDSWGSLDLVVHCIAFAHRDDLGGDFSKTTREGFRLAMDADKVKKVEKE